MNAAEDLSVGFNAVPDNPAVTVRTNRRQRVDRALEAVERVVLSANDNFKRLVIFVFANFARRELHGSNRLISREGILFVSRCRLSAFCTETLWGKLSASPTGTAHSQK